MTDSTAEQLRRRREAEGRLEPFDCGHRDPLDCEAANCGGDEQGDTVTGALGQPQTSSKEVSQPEFNPGDVAALWAEARSLFFASDFPEYGSQAWTALHPDDPKRLAAVLQAAEMWRRFGDGVVDWLREAGSATPDIASRRTAAELAEARKPKPPHQLRATPGWPPIAIPGQPGRYLKARQEMAA